MEVVEAHITGCDPIVWSRPRPFPFLCFLCGHDDAVAKLTIRNGKADVNVCLCHVCSQLSAGEILAGVMIQRNA